jgi:cell division protein FtsL
VIWTQHRARELFVELEQLNRQRYQLDVTWGQLQLEQSSLSQHARVESTARQRLDMLLPDPASIQVVLP